MPSTAPPRRPDVVLRDDVLDAAMALLREGGAEALSMRRLAAALGVSTQVVYSRVGGKADVARALHDRGFRLLREQVASGQGAGPDAGGPGGHGRPVDTLADVHALAEGYVAHAVQDPIRFELMFGTPIKEFQRDDPAREVEIGCFAETWVAVVRRHLDVVDPERRRGSAVRLAWRLWTAVHGIATVHLAGHDAPDGDPIAEMHAVVDLLLGASDGGPAQE